MLYIMSTQSEQARMHTILLYLYIPYHIPLFLPLPAVSGRGGARQQQRGQDRHQPAYGHTTRDALSSACHH